MTEDTYRKIIETYDWGKLKELWNKIKEGEKTEFAEGKAFEYLIIRAFKLSGAEVEYPFLVKKDNQVIEQIDGIIHYRHLSCLVECKDWSRKVDFAVLAKMRSQLLRRPSSVIGTIFSTGGFTETAIILSAYMAPQTILLWEKTEIEYLIEKQNFAEALLVKYKMYIKEGTADFNTASLGL